MKRALRRFLAIPLLLLTAGAAFSQPGYYRIIGKTENTHVFIGDSAIEDTSGQYPEGVYILRVMREGFHSVVRPIEIFSDHVVEITVKNTQDKPKRRPFRKKQVVQLTPITGTFVLTSDPPGEPVVVNGEERGNTPIIVEEIREGTHTIRIGEVEDEFNLSVFQTLRLRLENGDIKDVTGEDLPENWRSIKLDSIALFMDREEEKATNCRYFFKGGGQRSFKLEGKGAFIICRMTFSHGSKQAVKVPAMIRIYDSRRLLHEQEYELTLDPKHNNRLCYFHYDWWKEGEYILTIDGPAGNRLRDVRFIIYH